MLNGAAKAIRRTMESNEKAAVVIDHDTYLRYCSSILVFQGKVAVMDSCWSSFTGKGMNLSI